MNEILLSLNLILGCILSGVGVILILALQGYYIQRFGANTDITVAMIKQRDLNNKTGEIK